jgi:predicted alpha/beta superfamily hydrolase
LSERRAKSEGRLRIHPRFVTKYLSSSRDLIVYVPPGYDGDGERRHPVLYLQDGQNLFDPATAFGGQDWRVDETVDALIEQGVIEPIIVVGVYNAGVRRISEYTPTRDKTRKKGGKGDRYAQMLAREAKPFLDREYRTRRHDAAVGGSSLGGLVALEAALLYPRIFRKAAVLSPSVWWDNRSILRLVNQYDAPERPRLWLDAGTAEAEEVIPDLRLLRDALTAKGWCPGETLGYAEIDGADHSEAAWAARLPDVLRFLYGIEGAPDERR